MASKPPDIPMIAKRESRSQTFAEAKIPSLRITACGPGTSLQASGRPLARRWGVPESGALDQVSLALVNRLVDNRADETAIEIFPGGLQFEVAASFIRMALGSFGGSLLVERLGRVPPWQTVDLGAGDRVRVLPSRHTMGGYLAVGGGFEVQPVLGSTSTYARARIGGWKGQNLQAGDVLPLRNTTGPYSASKALRHQPTVRTTLRVIAGPQLDRFGPQALETLTGSTYRVTPNSDRMGVRLQGPPLLRGSPAREMLSDGIVPGCIQVPPDGEPILLLADCQTTGGYPKIAVVCSADLPSAGQLAPGVRVNFEVVTVEQAHEIYRSQSAALSKELAYLDLDHRRPVLDLDALYEADLIGSAGVYQDMGMCTCRGSNSKEMRRQQ